MCSICMSLWASLAGFLGECKVISADKRVWSLNEQSTKMGVTLIAIELIDNASDLAYFVCVSFIIC